MRFLILAIILSGCVSNKINRKLKRAERLMNEAIALGATVKHDTIYKKIPVFIDSIRVDSIFVAQVSDTIIIQKDRLRIKYIRLSADSVYIEGKCDTLTVIKEVPITVTKTVTSGMSVLDVVRWSLLALIIGAVLARIFWRRH